MRLVPAPIRLCRSKALLSAAIAVTVWAALGHTLAQPRPDVALHGSPDSVATHDRFTLTISASVPAHRAVQFPAADAGPSVFGDLTVLNRSPVRKQRVGAGYAISTVTVATSGSVRVDAAVDTVVTATLPRTLYVTSGPGAPAPHLGEPTPSAPSRFPWTRKRHPARTARPAEREWLRPRRGRPRASEKALRGMSLPRCAGMRLRGRLPRAQQ